MPEGINGSRVSEIFTGCSEKKVMVYGDVMVDEFLYGKVERISPEAPIPVLEFASNVYLPGGAANAACNISSLGGKAILVGYFGEDLPSEQLSKTLTERGVNHEGVFVYPERPTMLKTRVVAHTQQVVRIDREVKGAVDGDLEEKISNFLLWNLQAADALLICDYHKGTVTSSVLNRVIAESRRLGKPVVADTKNHRLDAYKGVTILTPNIAEAAFLTGIEIRNETELEASGHKLLQMLDAQAVLITRAEEGMSLFEKDGGVTHVPAITTQVHDVTGAGDTVAATITQALACGATLKESTWLANYAAAVVIRKFGTATASPEEIVMLMQEAAAGHII